MPARPPNLLGNGNTEPHTLFAGRLAASINETAEALNIDRDTVYRLISDGQLTISKLGRRTIVHVASIYELLAKTIVKPKPRVQRTIEGIAIQEAMLDRYATEEALTDTSPLKRKRPQCSADDPLRCAAPTRTGVEAKSEPISPARPRVRQKR